MSFYGQVKDVLPQGEQVGVLHLINQVKPLFATQSRPCAELMLAAIAAGRLNLIAGEFLLDEPTPTILQPEGTQIHPSCTILATGFSSSSVPTFYPQANDPCCYQVTGTSLSEVHKRAAGVATGIVTDVSKKVADCVVHI